MDGHRHAGPLSDDALDRDIEAALRVEPSPEFVARVRSRVAAESIGSAWWFGWRLAAVSFAAVVVLMAAVLPRIVTWSPADDGSAARATPPAAVPAAPARAAIVPDVIEGRRGDEQASVTPRTAAGRQPLVPRARTIAPARNEPKVLIAPEEAAALRQLFAAVNQRRIEPNLLPDVVSASESLPAIDDIVVSPITVSPLGASDLE